MTGAAEPDSDPARIAAALRKRLDALDPAQRAWSELWRDDRIQPWTATAADGFTMWNGADGADGARAHHLAVAHHARAWDAEEAGRWPDAVADWVEALDRWADVHADDGFWDGLADELRTALGERVPAADVVAAARRTLPARLLDVHVQLALRHAAAGRGSTGREHARLVTSARFPAADVADARRGFAAGLSDRVHDATERVRFRTVFEQVRARLVLDPDNPWLLEILLDIANRWVTHLNARRDGWVRRVLPLLDDVAALVEPHAVADEPVQLRSERARFESWQAFTRLAAMPSLDDLPTLALPRYEAETRRAVAHARAALRFEPTLAHDSFLLVGRDLAGALVALAVVRSRRDAPAAEIDELLVEARALHPAVDLGRFAPDLEHDPAPPEPERPDSETRGPSVDALLARARHCVLDGDGPGAVRALAEADRTTSDPGALPRIRGTMAAARALVRAHPPWDARLAELAARLETEGGHR